MTKNIQEVGKQWALPDCCYKPTGNIWEDMRLLRIVMEWYQAILVKRCGNTPEINHNRRTITFEDALQPSQANELGEMLIEHVLVDHKAMRRKARGSKK